MAAPGNLVFSQVLSLVPVEGVCHAGQFLPANFVCTCGSDARRLPTKSVCIEPTAAAVAIRSTAPGGDAAATTDAAKPHQRTGYGQSGFADEAGPSPAAKPFTAGSVG